MLGSRGSGVMCSVPPMTQPLMRDQIPLQQKEPRASLCPPCCDTEDTLALSHSASPSRTESKGIFFPRQDSGELWESHRNPMEVLGVPPSPVILLPKTSHCIHLWSCSSPAPAQGWSSHTQAAAQELGCHPGPPQSCILGGFTPHRDIAVLGGGTGAGQVQPCSFPKDLV